MKNSPLHQDNDIVISGLGVSTAGAYGLADHWQALSTGTYKATADAYSMRDFKAAPYLSDKRQLKAVSAADAIGLVAIEGLSRALEYKPGTYAADRVGLFVGAPTASSFDQEFYIESMLAARDDAGHASVRKFGATCMSSRPVALLIGLPNNVLCYGALLLDARGPNSNYTSMSLSAHLAVQNAARQLRRGKLDFAVAGGFSAHTEAVNSRILGRLGLTRTSNGSSPYTTQAYSGDQVANAEKGSVLADGGAFIALERRGAVTARNGGGAQPLATYLNGAVASDALGPVLFDGSGAGLGQAMRAALHGAGVPPKEIGLVLASGTGIPRLDACELSALSGIFNDEKTRPALGHTARVFGNLMEAGGVMELGILSHLYQAGGVPVAMQPGAAARFGIHIDAKKPHALILRASPWGEYSCIVARAETK